MSGLQPILIAGQMSGLTSNVKPWLVPDQAFIHLYNAYVYRDRIRKRPCLKLIGRLQRILTSQSLGTTSASSTTFDIADIFTTLSIPETNPEIVPGTFNITVSAPDTATFTDNGNGTFTVTGAGNATGSYINYVTGHLHLVFNAPMTGSSTVTANFTYYPSLPVMELAQYETMYSDQYSNIAFDTTYAYILDTGVFHEWIAGTTWTGDDFNGYWTTNYSASSSVSIKRYFIVTNFVTSNSNNPIRYTFDGTAWHSFAPQLDNAGSPNYLQSALIFMQYYGRLIALNTWEGNTFPGTNYFNRCRFSAVGDAISNTNAWRVDIPGQGGFIDAPTNEAIMSAAFYKNTLIVFFENSTWQLRYLGEYGLPFLWERISSDFGSISTFSSVVFDGGVLAIGDKAIISSTDVTCNRIDLEIPDQIFDFQSMNEGNQRVQGVRDFQQELIYWCYADSQNQNAQGIYPNKVLIYNYRNNTWAINRDNITAFGTYQILDGDPAINWSSEDYTWDDENVTWDDPTNQADFPYTVSGNVQGFVHFYGDDETTPDDPSLSITAISTTGSSPVTAVILMINNHNLNSADDATQNGGDIIYVADLMFVDSTTKVPVASPLANGIYLIQYVDADNVNIFAWNATDEQYEIPQIDLTGLEYIGGGTVALFPQMDIITKDFNPFQTDNKQMKISSIDFQTDVTNAAAITVNLFANGQTGQSANIALGNKEVETYLPSVTYSPNPTNYYPNFQSFYAWHRFYASMVGQFIRIQITYDNTLMNDINTHKEKFELNGIKLNVKPGGQLVF